MISHSSWQQSTKHKKKNANVQINIAQNRNYNFLKTPQTDQVVNKRSNAQSCWNANWRFLRFFTLSDLEVHLQGGRFWWCRPWTWKSDFWIIMQRIISCKTPLGNAALRKVCFHLTHKSVSLTQTHTHTHMRDEHGSTWGTGCPKYSVICKACWTLMSTATI